MTLKHLLDSLTFDEIAPFINLEDGKNTLAPFKQHFDYLRHLTPMDGVTGEVCVGYWKDPDLEEDDNKERCLFAGSLEGDYWESCLAKEIVLDEDVSASEAEIAGCCLWHTSFYGFLHEELTETFIRWHEGKKKRSTTSKNSAIYSPPEKKCSPSPLSIRQSVERCGSIENTNQQKKFANSGSCLTKTTASGDTGNEFKSTLSTPSA